jgi:thiamine biosynthesis lipoprotein
VIQRHAFDSMGTDVELLLVADDSAESEAALWAAEAEILRLEAMFTRFHPGSELSQLNADKTIVGSPELLELTDLSLAARRRTAGRFDPTVHAALVAAGYDRTFSEIVSESDGAAEPGRGCGGRVSVDRAAGTVTLDPDTSVDFGGIAKGYAVDRAARLLAETGPCLVSAGGDLAVHGLLDDGPWPVGIETADGTLTIGLERGAVATSGRDRRRWLRSGKEQHHIIDPSTGRPSESDLLRVTAVGASCTEAEVLATALFLAGEVDARREADSLGTPCVLVTSDGRTAVAGGLE